MWVSGLPSKIPLFFHFIETVAAGYKADTRPTCRPQTVMQFTGYNSRQVLMREMSMNGQGEGFARFIAYSSPYLFWVFVTAMTAGIWWLQ